MRAMTFEFGDRPWPAEASVLQVYLPLAVHHPSNGPLRELLARWRAALAEADAPVSVMADAQLHVTLDVVSDVVAGEITERERSELAEALRRRFADWPAWRGRAGSALAYSSGAIVDLSPAAPLADMAAAVREVITKLRGPEAGTYRQPKPHVSLGYAYAAADSDPVQRALRRVDPSGAALVLDELALVEVTAEPEAARLSWTRVAEIPLRTS